MLEAGKLDLALVQGEVAHEALAGVGRPASKLLIFAAMYTTPGMFVVRGDQPYRAIADLKGKPVVWGARGAGLVVLARYVLDGIGLDMERDFQSTYLDRAGDGPAMVMDGRAAALWGGGTGWPGFAAVGRGPQGARFIAPGTEERARIQAKHPFLKTTPIPRAPSPAGGGHRLRGLVGFVLADPICPTKRCTGCQALHGGESKLPPGCPRDTKPLRPIPWPPRRAPS
jgi:TRAP transporter TAXI family solute receptor